MSAVPSPAEPRLAVVRCTGGVYRSLEHWRGVAALWVMLFHAIGTEERPLHPAVEFLRILGRPGWLGVHLFFVISGYCIAANVQSLRAKGLGAFDFLRDRLCRILPTYWAAFGMTILLAVIAGRFNHAPAADTFPGSGRAWLGDLLLIQPYLGTKNYVIVYWTLVVEVGFYLGVALLFTVARVSTRLAVGLTLALAMAAVWTPARPAWLVLTYWPEFVCGLLIFHAIQANHWQECRRRNLCLGMIALLGILGGVAASSVQSGIYSPGELVFAAVFALVLYALYPLDESINRARPLRWLSFCGLFSYSLYLLHFPVGSRVYGISARFLPTQGPWYALQVLAFCLISVFASYAFYRIFEVRFERWRRRFKARSLLSAAQKQ